MCVVNGVRAQGINSTLENPVCGTRSAECNTLTLTLTLTLGSVAELRGTHERGFLFLYRFAAYAKGLHM